MSNIETMASPGFKTDFRYDPRRFDPTRSRQLGFENDQTRAKCFHRRHVDGSGQKHVSAEPRTGLHLATSHRKRTTGGQS